MTTEQRKASTHPLLIDRVGHSECLLGNEAIVRGALEAGVAFACGYPGTPSSEITDTFARIASSQGIAFEYSVNEKVALEMAFSASLAGARSICAMKHLGLLVAADPLSTIPYIGVEGGMVIVSAGDPGCGTSPNEQDQRYLGPMFHLPVLDPSTPQEALAMSRFAFELSEECRLPVLLRVTTRVCHSRARVEYGPIESHPVRGFVRNPARYNPIPVNARRMRRELPGRIERARQRMAESGFFSGEGSAATVVLASGAPAATCADVLAEGDAGASVALWNLGIVYPLPEAKLVERLQGVKRILVIEELAPIVEDAVQLLCSRHGLSPEILGKRSGHLPEIGDYPPGIIRQALRDALGLNLPESEGRENEPLPFSVPPRPPTLCPGCPHRAAFLAARTAFEEDQLYFNDIGCYTLGYGPPLDASDALLCMGAGFTLASGVSRVTGKRTVGFMGDSTFFHAGMPALLNAVKERANIVAVILDNRVTAMTGFQESAGNTPDHSVSIEAVVRALGVEQVETVDPYNSPATVAAFLRAREGRGVSVVIVEQACPVYEVRRGELDTGVLFEVDPSRCQSCGREPAGLRCAQSTTLGYERQLSRGATTPGFACVQGSAPCSASCPLALCIQGYVGHVAAGEYEEALGHIMSRTPLPETVCRVCHHPCEDACVRASTDAPVAINDLKRFVVTWAAAQSVNPYQPELEPSHGRKVAVVGAGPSGLAAAHDLRVRGYAVTLLDAADKPGGLLAHGIPAHRLPPEALQRDVDRILGLGIEFRGGTRLGREVTLGSLLDQGYDAVYLGVGANQARTLDLAGTETAQAPPVLSGLRLLERVARRESVEVLDRVIIIGGGNAAIDTSRTVLRLGARQVRLVCLESRERMPAMAEEILAAEQEGVEILPGLRPLRLAAQALICAPVDGGAEIGLETGQVFLAIGQDVDVPPSTGEVVDLERAPEGHLVVDPETARTSHPRVFAGGDVTVEERTVTAAMSAGQRAAWGIDCFLRGPEAAGSRPPSRSLSPGRSDTCETGTVEGAACETGTTENGTTKTGTAENCEAIPRSRSSLHAARFHPPELSPEQRTESFDEVVGTLTEESARAEAAHCLLCGTCANCRVCIDLFACPALIESGGHVVIDSALCTGCGVCAEICPNDAIRQVSRG